MEILNYGFYMFLWFIDTKRVVCNGVQVNHMACGLKFRNLELIRTEPRSPSFDPPCQKADCFSSKRVVISAAEDIRVLQDARLTGRMSIAHERHEADIAHGCEADLQELPRRTDGLVLLPR